MRTEGFMLGIVAALAAIGLLFAALISHSNALACEDRGGHVEQKCSTIVVYDVALHMTRPIERCSSTCVVPEKWLPPPLPPPREHVPCPDDPANNCEGSK